LNIKIFLRAVTSFFLPVLAVLISVNYFGDAANLFRPGIESKMAGAIVRGQNVTNIENFDERLFQREIIASFNEAPSIVVLGSSRTMQIRQSHFGEVSFFNHSVSGGTLEDYLAIVQLYENSGLKLKRIILCLDPWILNENHNQVRWKALASEYDSFVNETGKTRDAFDGMEYVKLRQLFSISYFKSSWKRLVNLNGDFDTVGTSANSRLTRLSDGSLNYGARMTEVTAHEVAEDAKTMIHGRLYSSEQFNGLSDKYSDHLERLVLYTKRRAIRLDLVLLPFHPSVYKHVVSSHNYVNILRAEEYFNGLADTNHIAIFGSYDPAKLGLGNEHFLDGIHCNEPGINKIMLAYLSIIADAENINSD
jgi:hypothetical protein